MRQASRKSYDHRIRQAVVRSGDANLFPELGIPKSTCRSWLRRGERKVVSAESEDTDIVALGETIAKLESRVRTLTAVLRLYVVLARSTEASLAGQRVPDARDKQRVLRAVEASEPIIGRQTALRILGLGRNRLHAWMSRADQCALDDAPPCPRTVPGRLTTTERQAIREMVEDDAYKHFSLRSLALLGQRTGRAYASYHTWSRLVLTHGWRRPRRRLYPAKPRVGIRATRPGALLHVDVSVIRLLDSSRTYLHAVVDNYSRKALAWKLETRLSAGTTREVLHEAIRQIPADPGTITVMTDGGPENSVFDDGSELGRMAKQVVAQIDVAESNSMVESLFNQLRHRWLYLHTLDSFATLERLITIYLNDHNAVIPRSALQGRTPDETFYDFQSDLANRLRAQHAVARRRRVEENRRRRCVVCSQSS